MPDAALAHQGVVADVTLPVAPLVEILHGRARSGHLEAMLIATAGNATGSGRARRSYSIFPSMLRRARCDAVFGARQYALLPGVLLEWIKG
jgi:hypothetical protein